MKMMKIRGERAMIINCEDIGLGSSLTTKDKAWLTDLAKLLYDEGWYTKAIYLGALVDNAQEEG